MKMVVGERIPFHLGLFLRHDFRRFKRKPWKIMLVHMLMAASLLIAGYWNSVSVPPVHEWREKMYPMFLMAKLTTMSKLCIGHTSATGIFQKQWSLFQDYCK